MAYFNQEMKKAVAARIKAEFPGWSVRLAVSDYNELRVTIVRADIDLLSIGQEYRNNMPRNCSNFNRDFNNGSSVFGKMDRYFGEGTKATELMNKFMDCVNLVGHPEFQNHDNSDSSRDHFDIGYYTSVRIGGNTPATEFKYVPVKTKKSVAVNDETFCLAG